MVRATFKWHGGGHAAISVTNGEGAELSGDRAFFDFAHRPHSVRLGRAVAWEEDGEEWVRSLVAAYSGTAVLALVVEDTQASTQPAVLTTSTAQSAGHDPRLGTVIGRLPAKARAEILANCTNGESARFVIAEGMSGALAAFDDRCIIVKKGGLTAMMAGATGGGRVTTFLYRQITGIEYNSGFVNGTLEILTASYQGTRNQDFWRGSAAGRNANVGDPFTLSNVLPLSKGMYQRARPYVDELRRLAHAAHQAPTAPAVPEPTGRSPTQTGSRQLVNELSRLAEMHQSGLLDEDEFKAAKRALLDAEARGS